MLLTALGRLLVPAVDDDLSSSPSSTSGEEHRGGGEVEAGGGNGGNDDRERPVSRSVRFREGDDGDDGEGGGETLETPPRRGGGGGGGGDVEERHPSTPNHPVGGGAAAVVGQERAPPPSPGASRRRGGGRGHDKSDRGTWSRPLLQSGSAQFYVTPAHPHRTHSPNNRQQQHRRAGSRDATTTATATTAAAAPSSPARADPRSGDEEPGILVAFGTEQLFTAPALLLLCPFAGLVVVLTFLDQEEWNWRACLERNVRKHVYGCQGAAFAILVMLGLECAGERLVREAFGVEQTVASRIFQRELAFFVVAMGIGLAAIEDTLTEGTSIFATALGSYMIFAGSLHWSQRLPTVMVIAFLWNGLQLIVIAWVGGNVVDGQWTSNWKG